MQAFDWIVLGLVAITFIYVSFVLTLRDWFSALRRGEAVTLLPERGGRKWPFWTQVAIVLLGLVLCVPLFYFGWIQLLALPAQTAYMLDVPGLILYLAGLVFVLWARRTLGKYWGLSTSMQVKLLEEHQLVQSGPYAFVRHPMYFGWWVCMFGLTLIYPVWAVFLLLVFSVISFANRARREEAVLQERFGSQWVEYKQRTRFLIPFIY